MFYNEIQEKNDQIKNLRIKLNKKKSYLIKAKKIRERVIDAINNGYSYIGRYRINNGYNGYNDLEIKSRPSNNKAISKYNMQNSVELRNINMNVEDMEI